MAHFIKPSKSTVAHKDNERSVNLDLVTDWAWKTITLVSQKVKGGIKGYEVEFNLVNNKKITHIFSDKSELEEYIKLIEQ